MKNLIALFFIALGISSSALAGECVVKAHSDVDFISAALANVSPDLHIRDIQLQRPGNSEATVLITLRFREKMNLFIAPKCETGALEVGLKVDSLEFTCQKSWINCMPSIGGPENRYCSREYATWAEKNCGGSPMIAQ